ncbi:membrane-bound dehydrogenase domain protein : Membrane-bound dehydrogenase domain-containing protein OS=Rhodopirellula maiorica SM1 GN=RMSM_03692 PE=4 SV=1: Cytochrom_C [Gemmata massiliana]|uniref:Cytochrome c domain-containing protein n=1 Tax=Gemmata massiliana TaxID=1210884 RepID=A0A6P2DK49_9BACT|nr:PVC-type heme-binding CxxCH protein [Gemmata massiliana]VTS01887.1 membrane-bound dehydrogenase domain protein : Membrane-bound dehydrogenase domain-containing protein OS=Rhodopirellula maiorica SM1 GN=RMSM_03692 PE=4 SV=1: Cytochrom_C [Gemmata massiliana]
MPRLSPAFALTLLVSLGGLSPPAHLYAQKEFGFDNQKGSGQPYLKPNETVAKIKVPDEFEVKLFAGEPQVVNPVAFTVDEKGRIWVVECFEYPKRTPKGKAPRDRIVILEDTDGDGVCDKRTVFAEGKDFPVTEERKKAGLGAFDLCTGIEVGHGGVFVGAAPYLWFIENKGDKAGKFDVLLKGFGSQDTHETLNTFQWGPDGWLYGLHGIFTNSAVKPGDQLDGPEARINGGIWRYHPKLKKFEIFAEGTSNPWGMDWRNTDGQFILACCVIPHLYHIVPGGVYKRQAGASFNPHAYSYLNEICDHTFHKESGWAHAGLISLDVPHMPKRFQNSVIFGSIHGCSIKQNVLKPNGSTYTASRGDDFLVSGDKNFRPINMKWGPNGDIYLIDWHDQNPCHQTNPDDWDYERGRVYRIQLKGTKTKKAEDLGKKSSKDLGLMWKETDPYRSRTAVRLLAERYKADDFEGEVSKATLPAREAEPDKMEAYWQRIGAVHDFVVSPGGYDDFMKKESPVLRMWATRMLGERIKNEEADEAIAVATKHAATEVAPAVRRELASAALRLSEKYDVAPLLRALMARKEDAKDPVIPQLVWLAYERIIAKKEVASTPAEKELVWLAEEAPKNEFVRDQIVPKVMRRLVATGQPSDLRLCVEFVTKLKNADARAKALEGLALALDKQSINAPEGWAALQSEITKENNAKHVALANKLGVVFRDPAALKRAVEIVANTGLAADVRVEAARQLGSIRAPETVALLLTIVRTDTSDAVRSEAVRALAGFDVPKLGGDLLTGWKEYPKAVRPDVINTLATRKEWARALLGAMADKKIDRAEVTDNTILRIQAFNDKDLNALIEKAWGRTRTTPADLAKLIDKTRESLYEAPASFERGRKVFENNCGKCHKFEGKGAEVGPPLDGAGRDIEYILGNVLDPNRVIGAPYFLRTARLTDDTVFSGLLAEEDDRTITLKLENAVLKKIKKEDLAEPVRVAEKSLMPEGLGYNMTPQDFRDLVRYLMANPFVTDVTVNGTKHAVGVPGRVVLPDTKGAPAVVEADVTASSELKTRVLVGSTADYEVRLDGKVIGTGRGAGKETRPDRDGFDVTVPAGKHTLAVVVKGGGPNAVYVRFLDPDRKLKYPDAGEKK